MAKKLYEETNIQDIANAIREKNGTESTYKTSEMGNAIREIESGSSGSSENPLMYAVGCERIFIETSFPNGYEITLDMPNFGVEQTNRGNISYSFYKTTGIKKVSFKGNNKKSTCQMESVFRQSEVEVIDFSNFILKPNMIVHCFRDCTNLTTILGEIDMSECTNITIPFDHSKNLKEIRFKPNTIKLSISFWSQNLLSNESAQSIINGLATVETSQTLTLHGTVKSKLTEAQLTQITSKNWTLA